MFCCGDWGGASQGTSYPGQRGGYTQTGGNALGGPNFNNRNMQQQPETVGVTVPPGRSGGDQITVSSPSGNCVSAIIPHGMRPGDTFMVEMPPNNNMNNNNNNNNMPGPPSNQSQIPTAPPKSNMDIPIASEVASVTPVPLPAATVAESRQDSFPSSASVSSSTNGNQKLMLVKVPPGVAPGSTINVQVPGENRMISAQVPPGVTEFHVAYEPTPQQQRPQQPVVVAGQPMNQQKMMGNNNGYNNSYGNNYNNNNNNGFRGNNGYGNNQRFGNNNNSYGNNGYNNGYNNNGYGNNGYNNNNNGYGNNYGNRNNGGGGMGFVAPVLAGAALMGGAGYLINHHQHQNDNQDDGNATDAYDGGGGDADYGGGDYNDGGGGDDADYGGGDYDDGGGDDFGGGDY